MSDRIALVEQLLAQHPSKVKELLVDYCQREDVRRDVLQYLGQNPRSGPYAGAHRLPSRLDTTFEPQDRSVRFSSQNPDPLDTHRVLPRPEFTSVAPDLPLSPARTASVTSHSTLPDSSGRERIVLLSCDDDDDGTEQQIYCRSAAIDCSLISDSRAQKAAKPLLEEVYVRVPTTSGALRLVKAGLTVSITWRRRKEFNSYVTKCYVVPVRYLDTDIIFTLEAAAGLQCSTDDRDIFAPNSQLDHGFVVGELGPKLSAPRSVVSPHVPSNLVHRLPNGVQSALENIENLANRQRMHIVPEEDNHLSRGSPIHTVSVPKLASTSINPKQQHQIPTAPTFTANDKEHASSSGQIRLTGRWGSIPINMRMDLNAPGEVFYQTFYRWAEERNQKIERERTKIWVKRDRGTPDEYSLDFGLGEEELEEVWEGVVEFIQENRREKGPHIYINVKTGTE